MNEGPDLSQAVLVSGANEPLNIMNGQTMQVDHGAERALTKMIDTMGFKPGEGINGTALAMVESTARIYTAHNALEANKGPGNAPSMTPPKPNDPKM